MTHNVEQRTQGGAPVQIPPPLWFSVGIAVLAGRGWMTLLAVGALAAVHFTAVLPEERYLTGKFGDSYIRYKSQVRRYL